MANTAAVLTQRSYDTMSNQIWTDGSNSLKTGWCGWAFHGTLNGSDAVGCGYEHGTNQRAELRAVIEALKAIPEGGRCEIISDSMYAINCLTLFREKWERNGFKTFNGHEISHIQLVLEGHKLMDKRAIALTHVRGHTGDGGNELADRLANSARAIAEGRNPEIDVTPFLIRGT